MPARSSTIRPARPGLTFPPVYSVTDRSAAAQALEFGAAPTLTDTAVSAMTDPDGVTALLEVAVEVESNRLQRPTTVVLRARDLTAVPAGPGSDTSTLTTGRRNATQRYAVADVAVADASVVFDADPDLGDEAPVAFGDPIVVVPTTGQHSADPTSTLPGPYRNATSTLGSPVALGQFALAGAHTLGGYVWRETTVSRMAAGRVLGMLTPQATSYLVRAGTSRLFTVTAYTGGAGSGDHGVTGRFRVDYTTSSGTTTVRGGVLNMASPSMGRYSYTFPITAGATDVEVTGVAVNVELTAISGTMTALYLGPFEFYAGPDRGALAALDVGVPTLTTAPGTVAGAWVEETWTDPRNVNRVEVTGNRRSCRITSARAYYTTDGATWKLGGQADSAGGRLAILFDSPVLARGVRLFVEECTGADPAAVFPGRLELVEVDPMYVRDATDAVRSASIVWAREAGTSDGTIPVGNYQASTLDLELWNPDNVYTPTVNDAIDTGHRIECALGVRYSNLIGNPRGDLDASGWSNVTRTIDVAEGWPYGSALLAAVTAGTVTAGYAPAPKIPTVTGRSYRVSGWIDVTASPGATGVDVGGTLAVLDASGATLTSPAWLATTSSPVGAGPQRVVGVVTVTGATAAAVVPQVTLRATTGTGTARLAVKLEQLDASGNAVAVDELVPGGVFYSDPWDAPSDSPTVTITAADRLGRFSDLPLAEPVVAGATAADIIRGVALTYLDLDDDQLDLGSAADEYAIPFAYSDGNVGDYLAELAKATLSTLYVDALDRVVLAPRGAIPADPVAEIRDDNALIKYRRPTGPDLTCASVRVTASPLTPGPVTDLWSLPEGGVVVQPGDSLELLADYSTAPAIGVTLTGVTASGAYSVDRFAPYATWAVVAIGNPGAGAITLQTLTVSGTPLVEQSLAVRRVDVPSQRRYGNREVAVAAPLVQTQLQLETIADVLLDAFRGVDDAGRRRLPDVELDALGLIHLEVDDRVTIVDPASGIGADYQLTSRTIDYSDDGSVLLVSATGREAPPSAPFAVADVSLADDVAVAGY